MTVIVSPLRTRLRLAAACALLSPFVAARALGATPAALPPCREPVRFVADYFADPQVDLARSTTELVRLGAPAAARGTALGLVTVESVLSVAPAQACRGLTVRLKFDHPVLRVARELAPASCAHTHVLMHEYTHVRVYREMARQFRALRYPWADARPDAVLRFAQHELAHLQDAQRQFDSPEEYAGNGVACQGEIPRLLAAARK